MDEAQLGTPIIFANTILHQHDIEQMLKKIMRNIEDQSNFIEIYKIMLAHYGKIKVNLTESNEIIYSIILPTHIKEIRPKKMNLLDPKLEIIKETNEFITERIIDIAKNLIKEGLSYELIAKTTKLTLEEVRELEV